MSLVQCAVVMDFLFQYRLLWLKECNFKKHSKALISNAPYNCCSPEASGSRYAPVFPLKEDTRVLPPPPPLPPSPALVFVVIGMSNLL